MRVDALLDLYKAEKEHLDDPLFGEPFPRFKEWVADIREDQSTTHRTVDIKVADKLAERAVTGAGRDLKKEAAKIKVTAKGSGGPTVTKKKVTAKGSGGPTVTKKPKRKSRKMSKVDKARNIYTRFYGKKTRKEIIDKFVAQCDLTKAGAATYYQKFKS